MVHRGRNREAICRLEGSRKRTCPIRIARTAVRPLSSAPQTAASPACRTPLVIAISALRGCQSLSSDRHTLNCASVEWKFSWYSSIVACRNASISGNSSLDRKWMQRTYESVLYCTASVRAHLHAAAITPVADGRRPRRSLRLPLRAVRGPHAEGAKERSSPCRR